MRSKQVVVCAVVLLAVSSLALFARTELPSRRYYVSTVFSWWPTFKDMSLFEKFVLESKRKGMNSISLDVPWTIRRENGYCDFAEYDRRIDYAVSRGMSVFIRVNSTTLGGQTPKWLTNNMLQCTPDGKVFKRDTDGGTLASLAHPVVRDHIVGFFRAVAQHYGQRYRNTLAGEYPVVALSAAFDLYMESEYFPDADVDYSPAAQSDFASWIRTQYPSMADLNAKWGTKLASWQDAKLKNAHAVARELYFQYTLQRILDDIGNAVHGVSSLSVGLQSGCVWDNHHRRTTNLTPLLRNLDWLFVTDGPDYNHAFTTDYIRCSAPGKKIGNEIDGASHPMATNSRYFNQGVRTYEHGANAVFVANWDLSNMRDNDKWPFLHFVGRLARRGTATPAANKAVYVSTWDLINRTAPIEEYLATYDALSEDGKWSVDVLPDYVIEKNPALLSKYAEIYLPANWTIPPAVRKALKLVEKKLKVNKPLIAGTVDEYGRTVDAFIKVAVPAVE